jgi:hypothetical protein
LTLGLNSIDPDPTGFARLDEAVSAHADVTGKADLMSPSLARITFLAISIAACHPAIGRAQGNIAFWLDDPKPTSWNTPGALITAAPQTQGPNDARCREQARPAQEDTRLRAQGWDLVGAYQGGWQMVVIPRHGQLR